MDAARTGSGVTTGSQLRAIAGARGIFARNGESSHAARAILRVADNSPAGSGQHFPERRSGEWHGDLFSPAKCFGSPAVTTLSREDWHHHPFGLSAKCDEVGPQVEAQNVAIFVTDHKTIPERRSMDVNVFTALTSSHTLVLRAKVGTSLLKFA